MHATATPGLARSSRTRSSGPGAAAPIASRMTHVQLFWHARPLGQLPEGHRGQAREPCEERAVQVVHRVIPAANHVGDPFQVSYFSNLVLGDGVINATNPGTLGAGLVAGTSADTTGAICLNVYAFAPDEQMISCCSCPVTPNGLVSMSVRQDLVSKSFLPGVIDSIVVKLVATVPSGGSCQGSATTISPLNLASSLNAWVRKHSYSRLNRG